MGRKKGLTQRRKVRKGRKENTDVHFALLCALAPLRELFQFAWINLECDTLNASWMFSSPGP
jgi:hypothetical protein